MNLNSAPQLRSNLALRVNQPPAQKISRLALPLAPQGVVHKLSACLNLSFVCSEKMDPSDIDLGGVGAGGIDVQVNYDFVRMVRGLGLKRASQQTLILTQPPPFTTISCINNTPHPHPSFFRCAWRHLWLSFVCPSFAARSSLSISETCFRARARASSTIALLRRRVPTPLRRHRS